MAPKTSIKTHYARLDHACQNLLQKMMQDLLQFYEPDSYALCCKNAYLHRTLSAAELRTIKRAATEGYVKFDILLIYKILRNVTSIPPPTKCWGHPHYPSSNELTIGDDVERIRRIRYEIIHRGHTVVTDQELKDYFKSFKEIARRFETILKVPDNHFVYRFEDLESCCMDEEAEEKYLRELEKYQVEIRSLQDTVDSLSSQLEEKYTVDSLSSQLEEKSDVRIPPEDTTCTEVDDTCVVAGYKTETKWHKEGQEIRSDNAGIETKNQTISKATCEDAGHCTWETGAGVRIPPEDTTCTEVDDTCVVAGYKTETKWHKEGQEIRSDNAGIETKNQTISKATCEDAGHCTLEIGVQSFLLRDSDQTRNLRDALQKPPPESSGMAYTQLVAATNSKIESAMLKDNIVPRFQHSSFENSLAPIPIPTDATLVPEGFEYNFFVSHSKQDVDWVRNDLLFELENKSSEADLAFKGCIDERDFTPGKTIVANISDAIMKSYKIILVLTKHFVSSRWCKDEMEKALVRHISKTNCVIPLLLEPLEKDELPHCLCNITYLDLTNLTDENQRIQQMTKLKKALLPCDLL